MKKLLIYKNKIKAKTKKTTRQNKKIYLGAYSHPFSLRKYSM